MQSGFCGIQGTKQSLAVAPDTSHTCTYPVLFLTGASVTLKKNHQKEKYSHSVGEKQYYSVQSGMLPVTAHCSVVQ